MPKLASKSVTADFGIPVTVPKGSIVTLKCTTNDTPNEKFELFQKSGRTIHPSVQVGDKELTIHGLSKDNRGTYCCKFSNDKGKAKACSKVAVGKLITPGFTAVIQIGLMDSEYSRLLINVLL